MEQLVTRGLGLKISSSATSSVNENTLGSFNVLVSIHNKTVLRDEWKNVSVLFIDEVSLLSLQILCEIDHALRYVKESQEQWFGGMIVIFSGDIYQFPPVEGSALYKLVQDDGAHITHFELQKRLGRLAWHSLTDVIELTEQQRMKKDPEYGQTVARMRKRVCIEADVKLLNSRVIKEYRK